MTEANKIIYVKTLSEETNDGVVSLYVDIAKSIVLKRYAPFDTSIEEVPDVYSMDQCRIAAFLLNKRGAEFERSHTESGTSRTYGSEDVPESLLASIIPKVGVFKRRSDEVT